MKKILSVLFAVLLFAGYANAQNKLSFSAGGNLALPMGSFGDVVNFGFGATVAADYPLADKIVGTATIGYLIWSGKDFGQSGVTAKTDFKAIPILAGVKYFVSKDFYALGQLGFHLFSTSGESKFTYLGQTMTTKIDGSSTDFTLSLGAGYIIGNLDIAGSFYIISNANYLGARVAYRIN
jgi:hypothetical protein